MEGLLASAATSGDSGGSVGLFGVSLALVGYGCGNAFVVVSKRRAARAGRALHPIAATLLGSTWILLLGLPFGLFGTDLRLRAPSAYGLLGGALWAPGKLAIILCTMGRGGMGVATGTTSGAAVLSSFVAGLLALGERWEGPLALLFIALMLAGIVGLAAARELSASGLEATAEPSCTAASAGGGQGARLTVAEPSGAPAAPPVRELLLGVGCCALGGVCIGCSTLPLLFEPDEDKMAYLAGYCLGQFVLIALTAVVWRLQLRLGRKTGGTPPPPLLVWEAVLPMACFGVLFVAGYLGSELTSAAFGLSVGYPVSQTSAAVAGVVSVVLGEVRGPMPIALFLSSCLAIVGGALGLKLA